MSYITLVTTIGQAKIANAIALGGQVSLTHMAVGDGNGNPTTPAQSQTALVRETYRGPISLLQVDVDNPNYIMAEFAVPPTEGGFTVHEAGLFDSDGNLFTVANFPATYKPILSEGSTKDLVVRMIIEVSNASAVSLVIDPFVAIATRQWVTDNFVLKSVIDGGLTGQLIRKKSNADLDLEWFDPADEFTFTVDSRIEAQTLAANQTIVNLALVNTNGMALYIEGARDFGFTINNPTRFTLDQSYPVGTKIWVVQNDALGEYLQGTVPGIAGSGFAGFTDPIIGLRSTANASFVNDNLILRVDEASEAIGIQLGKASYFTFLYTQGVSGDPKVLASINDRDVVFGHGSDAVDLGVIGTLAVKKAGSTQNWKLYLDASGNLVAINASGTTRTIATA